MPKTLQITDVPDDIYVQVCARAAETGQSVSEYLRELLSEIVRLPTYRELVGQAERDAPAGGGTSMADVIEVMRQIRD